MIIFSCPLVVPSSIAPEFYGNIQHMHQNMTLCIYITLSLYSLVDRRLCTTVAVDPLIKWLRLKKSHEVQGRNGSIVWLIVYLSARTIVLFMPGIVTYLLYQCRHRNFMRRYAMYEGVVGMLCCRYAGMPIRNVRRRSARRNNRLLGL